MTDNNQEGRAMPDFTEDEKASQYDKIAELVESWGNVDPDALSEDELDAHIEAIRAIVEGTVA